MRKFKTLEIFLVFLVTFCLGINVELRASLLSETIEEDKSETIDEEALTPQEKLVSEKIAEKKCIELDRKDLAGVRLNKIGLERCKLFASVDFSEALGYFPENIFKDSTLRNVVFPRVSLVNSGIEEGIFRFSLDFSLVTALPDRVFAGKRLERVSFPALDLANSGIEEANLSSYLDFSLVTALPESVFVRSLPHYVKLPAFILRGNRIWEISDLSYVNFENATDLPDNVFVDKVLVGAKFPALDLTKSGIEKALYFSRSDFTLVKALPKGLFANKYLEGTRFPAIDLSDSGIEKAGNLTRVYLKGASGLLLSVLGKIIEPNVDGKVSFEGGITVENLDELNKLQKIYSVVVGDEKHSNLSFREKLIPLLSKILPVKMSENFVFQESFEAILTYLFIKSWPFIKTLSFSTDEEEKEILSAFMNTLAQIQVNPSEFGSYLLKHSSQIHLFNILLPNNDGKEEILVNAIIEKFKGNTDFREVTFEKIDAGVEVHQDKTDQNLNCDHCMDEIMVQGEEGAGRIGHLAKHLCDDCLEHPSPSDKTYGSDGKCALCHIHKLSIEELRTAIKSELLNAEGERADEADGAGGAGGGAGSAAGGEAIPIDADDPKILEEVERRLNIIIMRRAFQRVKTMVVAAGADASVISECAISADCLGLQFSYKVKDSVVSGTVQQWAKCVLCAKEAPQTVDIAVKMPALDDLEKVVCPRCSAIFDFGGGCNDVYCANRDCPELQEAQAAYRAEGREFLLDGAGNPQPHQKGSFHRLEGRYDGSVEGGFFTEHRFRKYLVRGDKNPFGEGEIKVDYRKLTREEINILEKRLREGRSIYDWQGDGRADTHKGKSEGEGGAGEET